MVAWLQGGGGGEGRDCVVVAWLQEGGEGRDRAVIDSRVVEGGGTSLIPKFPLPRFFAGVEPRNEAGKGLACSLPNGTLLLCM